MSRTFNANAPVWAPADEGTPGGDAPAAATADPGAGGEGQAPGGGGESAPEPGKADDGAPRRSSILDYAKRGDDPGAPPDPNAPAWKLPDGLEVPEHLLGTTAEDTLRKLSTAYKGARQELSTRKPASALEGDVPKDISGYAFTADDKADDVLRDLASPESAPIIKGWQEAALELGIPDATFRKFMESGIRKMQEGGFAVFGKSAEDLTQINSDAEMAALAKSVGPAQADMIVHQIDALGLKAAEAGVLETPEDMAEWSQMFGTARAARIMSRFASAFLGEKPVPRGDGVDGQATVAEANAALEEALRLPQGAARDAAIAKADADLAKAINPRAENAGQRRSSVL